jgi:hypothetical protein
VPTELPVKPEPTFLNEGRVVALFSFVPCVVSVLLALRWHAFLVAFVLLGHVG